ncbi:hypothetical protein OE88DRAFT_322321 [Heliocybe sulcata]|uniref:Uncharacterized protein n=1 Tax=Heliocybe sulcata TaxID=5364 RepID=A0A5C3MZE3_9AGAM|nr:hypothetical protein OE88DRAFT_322321 [Heliocybe sulcata]
MHLVLDIYYLTRTSIYPFMLTRLVSLLRVYGSSKFHRICRAPRGSTEDLIRCPRPPKRHFLTSPNIPFRDNWLQSCVGPGPTVFVIRCIATSAYLVSLVALGRLAPATCIYCSWQSREPILGLPILCNASSFTMCKRVPASRERTETCDCLRVGTVVRRHPDAGFRQLGHLRSSSAFISGVVYLGFAYLAPRQGTRLARGTESLYLRQTMICEGPRVFSSWLASSGGIVFSLTR